MGKNLLDNFDVSLIDEMNKQIVLTQKSLEKLTTKDIMTQIDKIELERGEMENIGDTLIGVMNDLSTNKDVEKYLNDMVADVFKQGVKQKREERIRNGIHKLCKILMSNEYIVASAQDGIERRKEYNKLLKCMCALARVFATTKQDPILVVGSLNMIAEASDVCASGWKDTLTNIVINFKDDIERMFVGFECEEDEMKKLLEEIFFAAKDSVAREIEYKYIEDNGVYTPERPHYIDVLTRTLNQEYHLNLPQMELKDSYMAKDRQRIIKNNFIIKLKSVPIYQKIYDKACEFFYDKFKEKGAPYGVLSDWARGYIKKNNLGEYVEDVTDFMSTYLMTGEYGERIRFVTIKEIMKDYKFINERTRDISLNRIANTTGDMRLKRVMYDLKTQQEIERFNKELVTSYSENKDITFVFDFLKETKNYDVISTDTIQEIIRIGGNKDKKLLLEFCETGYSLAVKMLLNSGAKLDFKYKNKDNETVLMIAIKNKMDGEIIEKLIAKGVSVNDKNKDEETALMIALKNNAGPEIIGRLLEKGVKVNSKNKNEETALMIALKNKVGQDIIKKLLEKGANVNAKNNKGDTVLMIALKNKVGKEVIEKILNKGVDINAQNLHDETALMLALKNDASQEVINMLLNSRVSKIKKFIGIKIDLNKRDRNGETALIIAIKKKVDDKIIMELLNHGASVNKREKNKNSVLMYALKYSTNLEIINKILKNVKDINTANIDGSTALSFACRFNVPPQVVKTMIDMGANVTREDDMGYTPLAYTSMYGENPVVINMLLDAGADVNAYNKDKHTALMYALRYNKNLDMIRTLVKRGADVNATDKKQLTPLMVAIKYNQNLELVKFILNNQNSINVTGENGWTALMLASKYTQNKEIIKMMLKSGANVNKTNNIGETALMIASHGDGNEEIIKVLLENGADINKVNKRGDTALMLASVTNGNEKTIKVLLENGADVNISNINGWTALMLASKYNPNDKIVQAMIEKGADVNKKNYRGETVANIAKRHNPQIVEQVKKNDVLEEITNIRQEKGKEKRREIL